MIKLILAGTSSFGLPAFSALRNLPNSQIVGVLTQPARPVGRHQVLSSTPVESWATSAGLPILTLATLKSPEAQETIKKLRPDLMVVAAYGLILPPPILQIPTKGCLNIHASLLPAHRGASPIAAAILDGDQETGISYMLMDEGIDTGPVFRTQSLMIQPKETTPQLEQRLSELAGETIISIVEDLITDKAIARPQTGISSYAHKISRLDGQLDWDSGLVVERKIRAFTPWPGGWTTWQGKVLKILKASFQPHKHSASPGTIIPWEQSWAIVTNDGVVTPEEVQFEGKKVQSAASLPGSYPGFIGSQLG